MAVCYHRLFVFVHLSICSFFKYTSKIKNMEKKKLNWNEESEQEEEEEEEEEELLWQMKREAVTGSIRNNSPTTRSRHCYFDTGNYSLCSMYYLFIYFFS